MKLNLNAAKSSETKPNKISNNVRGGVFNSVRLFFGTKTFIFSSIIVASMLCLLFIQSCNETPIQTEELQEEFKVDARTTVADLEKHFGVKEGQEREMTKEEEAMMADYVRNSAKGSRTCTEGCTYDMAYCPLYPAVATTATMYGNFSGMNYSYKVKLGTNSQSSRKDFQIKDLTLVSADPNTNAVPALNPNTTPVALNVHYLLNDYYYGRIIDQIENGFIKTTILASAGNGQSVIKTPIKKSCYIATTHCVGSSTYNSCYIAAPTSSCCFRVTIYNKTNTSINAKSSIMSSGSGFGYCTRNVGNGTWDLVCNTANLKYISY